jgi:hypothetical protein
MFTLKINTNNAAFGDDSSESNSEVSRILGVVSRKVEGGATSGLVLDLNGNTVGSFNTEKGGN